MKLEMIHTKICLLLWIIVLSVLSACQPDIDESLEQGAPVNVVVSTRATTNPDAQVNRLRLIVTGWNAGGTGTVSYNQLIESPGTTTGFKVKARKGDNNFYLVANETPEMTTALGTLKTAAEVEQFNVNFQPLKAGESPVMFGAMKKVAVVAEDKDATATVNYTDENGVLYTGVDKLPMTLTRIAGRFSLTFIKNSDAFTVKDINFKVLRIPSYSFLDVSQFYPGTVWSTETLPQSSNALLTTNNTATWNNATKEYTYGAGDKISFADFYLPEHLPTDSHRGEADYSTVLLVNGTCILPGGREQDANWQVNLMANNDFKIKRNTWYKVAISITGMGAMGMAAEVTPVTEHDIPVNWGVSDGLIVVSDRTVDYGKNISVSNDMTAYSGILKVVKTQNGTATYHDALFKYGSVIGISAPTTSGTAYDPTTNVIYDPALSGKSYLLTPWTAVPAAASSSTLSNNTYLALKQGLGDPCQLIGVTSRQMEQGRYSNGLWHIATPEEMQRLIDNSDAKAGVAADSRGLLGFSELLVPVSARRDAGGTSIAAGGRGYYWSSGEAKRLVFAAASPGAASIDNSGSTQEAYPVRCVRNSIPESKITAANTTVSYQGGTFSIPVNSNVPHWKAELITSDKLNGDVTGAGDPSGVVLHTTSGSYAGSISVSVPRRAQLSDRNCYIRITGMGYDGIRAKRIITLLQNRLEWRATIMSNTMDQAGSKLPGTGGSYTAVLSVTPVDEAAFPSDVTYRLTVSASGAADIVGEKISMKNQTVSIPFTISENTLPDIRMVMLKFEVSGTGVSCRTEQSKVQAKK